MNIGQITKMAQQLQTQMAQAQEELKSTTLEATAGGGAVRVVITGAQEVRSVEIDPSAVDLSLVVDEDRGLHRALGGHHVVGIDRNDLVGREVARIHAKVA